MPVKTSEPDGLRVILCFAFDHRAPHSEVEAFKRCIINCAKVTQTVELSGAFDLMIEAKVADLVEYNERLKMAGEEIARLVKRFEANFICKRYIRTNERLARCLWVPTTDGFRRIDCHTIDKITAEADYMRLHCGEHSWLYHITMSALLEQLDPEQFYQLHRSAVVRVDFVERLVHQENRWIARLQDGTVQKIARGHVQDVLKKLRHWSSNEARSAMREDGSRMPALKY